MEFLCTICFNGRVTPGMGVTMENNRLDKSNEFARAAVLMLRAAVHRINENIDRRDFWLEPPTPAENLRRYNHINMTRLASGGY
jgi:hypothetical protein